MEGPEEFSEPTHQLVAPGALQVPCKPQGPIFYPEGILMLSQFLQGGQRGGFWGWYIPEKDGIIPFL